MAELSYFGFDVDGWTLTTYRRLADFCDLIADQQKFAKAWRIVGFPTTDYRSLHCVDAAEYIFKQFCTHAMTGSPAPLVLSLKATGNQIDQLTKEEKATWAIVQSSQDCNCFSLYNKMVVEDFLFRMGLKLTILDAYANLKIKLATAQVRIELSTRPLFP